MDRHERYAAYFSMEMALDPTMPTYAGGLGILAGDTIRAAADARIKMIAVTLVHRKGYFTQRFDANGWQSETDTPWDIAHTLDELPNKVSVLIAGRLVAVRAWKYEVKSQSGFVIPVYLLDTDLPENSEWDRTLTDHLDGGDACTGWLRRLFLEWPE